MGLDAGARRGPGRAILREPGPRSATGEPQLRQGPLRREPELGAGPSTEPGLGAAGSWELLYIHSVISSFKLHGQPGVLCATLGIALMPE